MRKSDEVLADLKTLHPRNRPVARANRGVDRHARQPREAPCARHAHRRHQRQGLDRRLYEGDPGRRWPARPRLHLAPPRPFPRTHRACRRRRCDPPHRRSRARGRLAHRESTPATQSPISRSPPRPLLWPSPTSRRCCHPRGRAGRPARRHQRGCPPLAERHHPGLSRPRRQARQHAIGNRRREGRHSQGRRACRRLPAAARGARCHSLPPRGRARRAADGVGRGLHGLRAARSPRVPERRGAFGSAAADAHGAAPDSQRRHRRCCREAVGQPWPIDETAIEHGLVQVRWPARMQRLDNGPLSRLLAPGSELWLDGAHNLLPAGQALAQTLAELEERAPKPVALSSA